jgi:exo-beta-1,3-glucanase (GH17 family)
LSSSRRRLGESLRWQALAAGSVRAKPTGVSRTFSGYEAGPAVALLALTALAIGAAWWWLGAPVQLPPSPLAAGEKYYCISYAPFRNEQNPLVAGTHIEPEQIEEDLTLLSKYTDCIRTYSIEFGQDRIPEIAQRHGLKVLHGIWLSNHADANRKQIDTTIALAKQFPDVIRAVIVGNEVLLRGEMSATDLMATIREVKSQISMPVTYTDVWEYWLRYRDVQNAVDFVTIHILPYWEDFPLPARLAAAHVDAIRQKVAAAIPGKDILIGEIGWPSAGRMREGALPSPVNQARVIQETVALSKRENFNVNVIEAFDQPWKRRLEGAVGGHWGIIDQATRLPKFVPGGAVSDHPDWRRQAVAGIGLAALMFGAAFVAGRRRGVLPAQWLHIAAFALIPGVLIGWTIETVPVESFDVIGWTRTLAFAGVAVVAPIVCAAAYICGRGPPTFARLLGGSGEPGDVLAWALGLTLIALCLLAVQAALGLVFDPRYRDIPFAPLTTAVVPFLVLTFVTPRQPGQRALAETVIEAGLVASAGYIVLNEGFANWQALWFCAALLGLAFILERARAVPG